MSLIMSMIPMITERYLLLIGLVAVWFLQGVFTECTSVEFELDEVLQATSACVCLALLLS